MAERFEFRWEVPVELIVSVEADSEEAAEEIAARLGQDELNAYRGDVRIFGSIDGAPPASVSRASG